jgi:predicted TIM-barrel fold metal-dependent hydrolase
VRDVARPLHFGDDAAARTLARRVNEYLADIKRDRPDRFGGFAALPLPDVDASLEQLAYASRNREVFPLPGGAETIVTRLLTARSSS